MQVQSYQVRQRWLEITGITESFAKCPHSFIDTLLLSATPLRLSLDLLKEVLHSLQRSEARVQIRLP